MSNELVPSYARYTDENYVDKKVTWENLPDKPFYSEVKDVFIYETQETEVGYVGSDGVNPAIFTRLGFEIGKTYKVIWNGMEYTCTAFEASMEGATGIGVGNIAVAGGENTGEPFIIADVIGTEFGTVIDLTASSSGTATFGIIAEKEVVTKIPEKFLPKQKENLSEFNNDLYGEQDELEVILNKDDVEFTYQSQYGLNSVVYINKNLIKEVAIYVVKIDGKKYRLESKLYSKDEYDTVHVLGNGALYEPVANKLGNTGEPFFIYSSSLDGNVIVFAGDENSTFELYKVIGTEIKRIPKKYLPDSVALSEFKNDLYGEQYELETIIPEGEYTFRYNESTSLYQDDYFIDSNMNNWDFKDGEQFIVIFDGIKYKLNPSVKTRDDDVNDDNDNYYAAGNLSLINKGENTGEPFVIESFVLDGTWIATSIPGDTHTIKIDKIISTGIKQIPSEYVEPCFGEVGNEYIVQDFVCTEENEGILPVVIDFVEGQTYTVIYNNETEYKCVAKKVFLEGIEAVCIGNIDTFMDSGDTGEPFIVATINMGGMYTIAIIMDSDGSRSFTIPISIKGSIIKYIDPKYIDTEWMAVRETQKTDCLVNETLGTISTTSDYNQAHFDTDHNLFNTGEIFIVQLNNKEYQCKINRMYNDAGELKLFTFGNMAISGDTTVYNTGEPFFIVCDVIDPDFDGNYIIGAKDVILEGVSLKIWRAEEKANQLPPEFIKDIYYDGSKVLIPMSTLRPDDTHNSHLGFPTLGLELGQKYIVTYNGVKHELTPYMKEFAGNPYITLGDQAIYDFEIVDDPALGAYSISTKQYTEDGWEPFTIEVIKEEIHQIDPKYIADMYHDDTKVILPMSSLTCNDTATIYMSTIGHTLGLEVGEKYNITFNSIKYECISYINENIALKPIVLGGSSSEYPFCIEEWLDSNCFSIVCNEAIENSADYINNPYSFTIEIIKEDLHKIDNKYIDAEWMATKEVGEGDTIYSETFTTTSEIIEGFKSARYYTDFTGNVNWRDFEIGKKYIIKEISGTHIVEARPLYDSSNATEIVGVIFGNSTLDPAIPEKCKLDTGDTFYIILSNDASYANGYVSEKRNSGEFTVSFSECVDVYNKLPQEYLPESVDYFIMNSSTEGSTKQFKITIGDDGVLVASEL